ARAFREPLVPADRDADARAARFEHLEPRVAGTEVVLLLVAGPVRYVRLAIHAEIAAVGIQNRDGIEEGVVGLLEEADRQHDAELARNFREMPDGLVVRDRSRDAQVTRVLLDAEIRRLEQFLDQDDLGAA